MEIAEQVDIARPVEAVWAELADFGRISRWAATVDHSCLITKQSAGVDAVRRVQVGRNALLERVVAWEPGQRLAYDIDGLPPVVKSVTNSWSLEASGDGTTVTLASLIKGGPRPPQQVAARVFGRVLAKASRDLLGGLKAHLESGGSRP